MRIHTVSKYYTLNNLLYMTFITTLCYLLYPIICIIKFFLTDSSFWFWFGIEMHIIALGPLLNVLILLFLPIERHLIKINKLKPCKITATKKLSRILIYSAFILFIIGTIYWYEEIFLYLIEVKEYPEYLD